MVSGKWDIPLLQRCNSKQRSRKCSRTPVNVLSCSTTSAFSPRNSAEVQWGCSTASHSSVHLNDCTYPHSFWSLFPSLLLFLSTNVEKVEFLDCRPGKGHVNTSNPQQQQELRGARCRLALCGPALAPAAAAGAGQQVGLVLQQRRGLRSGNGAQGGCTERSRGVLLSAAAVRVVEGKGNGKCQELPLRNVKNTSLVVTAVFRELNFSRSRSWDGSLALMSSLIPWLKEILWKQCKHLLAEVMKTSSKLQSKWWFKRLTALYQLEVWFRESSFCMIHERKLYVLRISLAVSLSRAVAVCWKAHKCLHAPLLERVLKKHECMHDDSATGQFNWNSFRWADSFQKKQGTRTYLGTHKLKGCLTNCFFYYYYYF